MSKCRKLLHSYSVYMNDAIPIRCWLDYIVRSFACIDFDWTFCHTYHFMCVCMLQMPFRSTEQNRMMRPNAKANYICTHHVIAYNIITFDDTYI